MALPNINIFTLENFFHKKLTKNIPVKFEDTIFWYWKQGRQQMWILKQGLLLSTGYINPTKAKAEWVCNLIKYNIWVFSNDNSRTF